MMRTFTLCLLFAAACTRSHTPRESLLIAGNAALVHYLQPLVKDFEAQHPDVRVVVEPGGTTAAVIALKRGAIDVAALSRLPSFEEDDAELRDVELCRDGIAIIVNKANPVANLTRHQLEQIFEGTATSWESATHAPVVHMALPEQPHQKPAKGHHHVKAEAKPEEPAPPAPVESHTPITVYVLEGGRSTSRSFSEMVLGGDEPFPGAHGVSSATGMLEAVAAEPNAIGYLALRHVTPDVKELKVDGVEMNRITMLSGRYPLSRAFFLATYRQSSASAKAFVDFATSAKGQEVLEKHGLLQVR
jgi:phosphate transport system substrate-binding protein